MSDELPDWVVNEIQNVKFKSSKARDGTGYILETYPEHGKADIQLHEPVEDGRHIITMDMPDTIKMDDLERGTLYQFAYKQHKAPLSKKAVKYLQTESGIDMKAIYRFELSSFEVMKTDEDYNDDDDDDDV